MPRSILLSNAVLLLCTSLLLGAALCARLADVADPQRPLPGGWFVTLTAVSVVTALVMLLSEWFTGIRWVAVVAAVGVALSLLGSFAWTPTAGGALALWLITWVAVAYWFYRLAYDARADR